MQNNKKNEPLQDSEMIKVSRELFTDGLPLPAEVFTKLASGQYILLGKKADKCNLSSLHLAQDKTVEFFVRKTEYSQLISYNLNLIKKTVKNNNLGANVKMSLLKGITESAISDLTERGVYVGSYEKCKQIATFVQETTAQIKDMDKFIDIFNSLPGDMVGHSLATSVVSMLICDQMNITMKSTIEKVILGSLLHDIGLKEIPDEILAKPRYQWTEAELQHYESHTLRGVELLRDIKEIPSDVLSIVMEHHENALGMGYPRRIRDIKIHPLARIVAVADCFVDLVYDSQKSAAVRKPEEAIAHIEFAMGQPFNKPAFLALKQVIHLTALQKKMNISS